MKDLVKTLSFFIEAHLPDALSFAIWLTFIVLFGGMFIEHQSFFTMINYWGSGIWSLLPFAMQMILILILGITIADTPLFDWLIRKLLLPVQSAKGAIIVVTLVATVGSWLNWGLGLVLGGVVAIAAAKKIRQVHFPLLIASAYSGFVVWHGGLSGSIPLKLATASGFMTTLTSPIPIGQTIFSWQSIILSLIFLVTLPVLNLFLLPTPDLWIPFKGEMCEKQQRAHFKFADYFNSLLLGFLFLSYLGYYFYNGGHLNLNIVNALLFAIALLLHPTTNSFITSVEKAMRQSAGIVIQFPLYAGIMGMMAKSGLTQELSNWFIAHSTAKSFPVLTYLSAGLVNFFVPSGGGQWAVQGPIVIPAAQALGVPISKVSMALAWGDAWTNMLQPFWALPLLGMSGLKLKDIMFYCLAVACWVGVVSAMIWYL